MVDQPRSPAGPRAKTSGTLTLPQAYPGLNRTKPNENAIAGKGTMVGPDIDPNPDRRAKQTADDEKILGRMRKRMERCIASEADNRKAGVDDLKFKAGEQWPSDVAQQRNTDKRPCLTNNRMLTFVHQVTNPARENRPSILISPIGSRGDKEAAKVFQGLIRAVERESHADIAYDTALDSAVSNGWGYMRLVTEWKSEKSFFQVPVIKRVRNPFTVYLDPDRQEPDGSDARFGFITEMVPEDEFEREYPKAQKIPFDLGATGEKYRAWITKDGIRVAEYYEIEEEPAVLVEVSTGWQGYEDEMGEVLEAALERGRAEIVRSRKTTRRKVMHYKATAIQIIERTEWLGKWIPIVQVIGDEIDIEGKVRYSGIIRFAKDAQRMDNYWSTAMTEFVALAPKAPYIMEEGQIEGHEQEWKTANIKASPVLTYKATDLNGRTAPPPQRSGPPSVPEGIVAAQQSAQQAMMATTGIRFDSTLQERMHNESGKALRELNRKTDIGAFHYYDNFRRSLEFLGKQLVDLLPKQLTEKQVLTILREDDTEQNITIDPLMGSGYREQKGQNGVTRYFNPAFGEYGVTVDVGPSYVTRRQEAAESMMDFVKALPNTAQLVMDLIASEMDWPGADKIATRLAKAIPPQMLTADIKDVPPQIQALIQNLEAQSKQLGMQLQAAMKALNDKDADRQVKLEKISTDFEAKILGMLTKAEGDGKKIAAEEARAVADIIVQEMRANKDRAHETGMAVLGHALDLHKAEHATDLTPPDNDASKTTSKES